MYVGQWHDYFIVGSVEERTSFMSIYRIPTAVSSHTTVHAVEGKPERHPVFQLIPLQCDEHQKHQLNWSSTAELEISRMEIFICLYAKKMLSTNANLVHTSSRCSQIQNNWNHMHAEMLTTVECKLTCQGLHKCKICSHAKMFTNKKICSYVKRCSRMQSTGLFRYANMFTC